jgi:5-methylcytosine-specific restriction endonuclease McrA
MTRDHIQPKSKGGPETLENMQTMCTRCNGKKGNKV